MKHYKIIAFYLCLVLVGCQATSAQKLDNRTSLLEKLGMKQNGKLTFEKIINKQCSFSLPVIPSDDTLLINALRKIIANEQNALKKYCNEHCEIEMSYEVKTYIKSSFVSILETRYEKCSTMPSYSISSVGYNLLYNCGAVYLLKIEYSGKAKDEIDSIVKQVFDEDCLNNGDLNNDLDLYFEDGAIFINNPLHSKVCDESIKLNDIIDQIKFIKL